MSAIIQTWWSKNRVLVSAVAGAVVLVLQQFITQKEIDYKALGLALLMAIAGVLGKELRGKNVTIATFIGITSAAFVAVNQTGNFTWMQFILTVTIGFLGLVASPAKSDAYEKTGIIEDAKKEAAEIKLAQKT